MKTRVNRVCSVLAILAACQCASALAPPTAPFIQRIYVTDIFNNVDHDKLLLGVILQVNTIDDTELLDSVFVMLPAVWTMIQGSEALNNSDLRRVPLDEMPLKGLFKIGESHPALYPRLLPHLLARTSPEMVANNVPEQHLGFLTPEAGSKIYPLVIKRLEKLSS